MATDHNFKVKNGLNVEGAGLTIVGDGSESRVTSGGEIRFRPEGSSSNKVRITLNTLQVQGNVNTTTGYQVNGSNVIDGSGNWAGGSLTSTSLDINGNATVSGYLNFDGGDQNGLLRIGGLNVIGKSNNFLYIDPSNSFSSGIYINNQLKVNGGLISSYDEDLQLRAAGTTVLTLSNTDSSASFVGDVDVAGDLDVTGDLNITGDINSVSVTDLDVVDKTITLGVGQSAANSTGSGIVISGANANILWHNTNDRWEFNKDIHTSGNIDLGNARIYASGDSNSIHIHAPTAIIGPSTTTASNPSLGLSTYRWNGLFSSTGSFSGTLAVAGQSTLARPVLVNGAHDNSGKADFAVDGGEQISLYDGQVQMGGTDMNWSARFFYNSSGGHVAVWDNNLEFFTQGSNTGSATARDIIFSPQISGTAVPTERMRIKGSGNVGIGTNAPAALLHVSSGTSGDATVIIESDTDNNDENDNPQLQFKQDGGITIAKAGLTGDAGQIFGNSLGNAAYFGNDEAAAVQFYTNATARLTIDSSGNVGIGTTSLTNKFHVSGNARIEGNLMVGGAAANNVPVRPIHIKSAGDAAAIRIEDTTNSNQVFDIRSTHGTGLLFIDDTAGATRMTIDSAGRVGIGTAPSSATNLHVQGNNSAVFRVDAQDGGSAPAMTARIQIHGYEGRGAGIKIKDSVNSASGASDREWFIGSGYNQSGFNIGYAANGSQSSYAAQNKFALDTSGNATFYGEIYAKDSNSSTDPTITFTGHTNTGLAVTQPGGFDHLWLVTDGTARAYANNSGFFSEGNLYSGNSADFRNFGGEWHATTGTTGNGFRFTNTADSVDALVLTAAGNATFAGTINSGAITSTGSISGTQIGVTNIVTNKVVKFNGSILDDSNITDSGTLITLGTSSEVTGTLTVDSGTAMGLRIEHDTFGNCLELHREDATNAASITFSNNSGTSGILFAIHSETDLYWRKGTGTTNYRIWTEENDGASSGLNADLLDDQHGSYYTNASNLSSGTIPSARFPDNIFDSYRRDTIDSSSEDFNNYLTTGTYAVNNWSESGDTVANGPTNTTAGGAYPWGILRVTNWQAASGSSSGTGTYVLQEYWPHQTDVVYSRIMWNGTFTGWRAAWGNENDGSGSGLDADKLDGVEGASFLRSDATDTASGVITFSDRINLHEIRSNTSQEVIINAGESSSYAASQTDEYLYVNADTGFQVNVSPDNWSSAWAGRKTLTYDGTNGLVTSGGFSVDTGGNLSATTKSFDIEHPTKEGMRLRYGVLEGPENGVYVRGRTKGSVIQLPDHWTGLVHEDTITVQLTPIGKSSELYVKDIADNKVLVSNDTEYFYYIMAERKDVERFEVEYES